MGCGTVNVLTPSAAVILIIEQLISYEERPQIQMDGRGDLLAVNIGLWLSITSGLYCRVKLRLYDSTLGDCCCANAQWRNL